MKKVKTTPLYPFLLANIHPYVRAFLLLTFSLILPACSSQKFLQSGQSVLSDVKVTSASSNFKANAYRNYVRQEANAKWFTLFKVPLGIYCLSKADSIKGKKGFSRILRNIGEAPVVYDSTLTKYSMNNLEQAMKNDGYLHATIDTLIHHKTYKTQVNYILRPGSRFYIQELTYDFDHPNLHRAFQADSAATLLKRGMPLNLNKLSEERGRIVKALHDRGFYYLNKDYISYDIDTLAGSLGAAVHLRFRHPHEVDTQTVYTPQRFRQIRVIEEGTDYTSEAPRDSVDYGNLRFKYVGYPHLNKRVYLSHIGLRPDSLYREREVQSIYSNLNALPAISYTTLKLYPVPGKPSLLDCDITLRRKKPHSIGLELEGTNTSGDLGAAVALTYSNRNLFRGSELFALKLRGAYEAITGLEGYSNQNYIEWSAEANLRFPTLLLPFISIDSKRQLKATSEAKLMYDMQDRPEFHRRVLTGAWAYRWNRTSNPRWQNRWDLLSLNYVYMPWISETFRKEYLEGDDPYYSVLKYSYEDLFIMNMGYSFVYNSLHDAANLPTGLYQTNGFQIKASVEIAGNLLYGLSKATRSHRNSNGNYQFLGIAYSQYAKLDFDFTKSVILNDRNSLAFHAAFGIGIPYGNSTILPYEKRYFAGGANSVRGWSVRELGPGSYREKDGRINFINQTGNLKLDLSAELRTFLFWKLHGAFFIDAGNVWNTRSYPDMNGALFKFNRFYKEIAVAYGLGLRLNFDYFILRLDGGMKAINPAVTSGRLHYPITQPSFKRDFTLHFAVGLPF